MKRLTLEEHRTIEQIADQLGVHVRQIERDRRAIGLSKPAAPRVTLEEEAEIRRLVLEEELPVSEAVRRVGRTSAVLRRPFAQDLPRLTRQEYGSRGGLVRKGNMVMSKLGRRGLGETPAAHADVLLPDAMLRPQYGDQTTRKDSA